MGREQRERKSWVQWQAKGPEAATAAVAAKLSKAELELYATEVPAMRDLQSRTKVVVRRLPPTMSSEAFVSQIEVKFAGTYSWLSFHAGKLTPRKQVHSRAYIDFKSPQLVYDFHAAFDGHVFVNEKGSQFKACVEYAPYQRVPERQKKDVREGTIYKDPEYLEFLEMLAKPVETLPSAEVQLERKEAERQMSGAAKGPIVTPLMEYVLQLRGQARSLKAAKAAQRSAKSGYRAGIMGSSPLQQKRDKGKASSSAEGAKEAYSKARKRPDFKEKKPAVGDDGTPNGNGTMHKESTEEDKDNSKGDQSRRKLLLKEKDKNGLQSTYSYKERPSRAETLAEKRISRSQAARTPAGDGESSTPDDKNGNEGRRLRNKDRPDRPVWTPRRRLDAAQDAGEGESEFQGGKGPRSRRNVHDAEAENDLEGRNGFIENGAYRGRKDRLGSKDGDEYASKHGKRGATPSLEKQVWVAVQKPGSGP